MSESKESIGGRSTVYRHSSKTEWGLAVLVWEQDDRRGYQFEDGALRVFKEGYYDRLEEVDVTADRVAGLAALRRVDTSSPGRPAAVHEPASSITLDEQLDHFLGEYPGGFGDAAWRSQHRGGSGRAFKSHREPAIAAARTELSEQALDALVDTHRNHEVVGVLCRVLARTDLVPAAQVTRLTEARSVTASAVGTALVDLLWNANEFAGRFAAWVSALGAACGKSPSWELVTAPLGLVHPDDHVCIKPIRFHAQASWMAPSLRFGTPAAAASYTRGLAMAQQIRQRIAERGQPGCSPADLFDVHDFIGFTLAPKACTAILDRRGPTLTEE